MDIHVSGSRPTRKAPPDYFTGTVLQDPIIATEAPARLVATRVTFEPGARTAWHSHARGQYLRITEGVARFGSRDGTVVEVYPGQTLYTPPGEDHWHAAAPGCFMEHIAMLEAGDDPATSTTWNEHVTDEEYTRAVTGAGADR